MKESTEQLRNEIAETKSRLKESYLRLGRVFDNEVEELVSTVESSVERAKQAVQELSPARQMEKYPLTGFFGSLAVGGILGAFSDDLLKWGRKSLVSVREAASEESREAKSWIIQSLGDWLRKVLDHATPGHAERMKSFVGRVESKLLHQAQE